MRFASTSSIFTSAAFLLSATMSTFGLPVQLEDRTVYNLHITFPKAGVVFTAGSTTNVTWDTSSLPADNDDKGTIMLGYMEGDNPSEHLDVDHPLASGFKLCAGWQMVTLPVHLPSRDGYILVLFGDSGNRSPLFTINATS